MLGAASATLTVRKTIGFYCTCPFGSRGNESLTTPSEQRKRRLASGIAPDITSATLMRGVTSPARPITRSLGASDRGPCPGR